MMIRINKKQVMKIDHLRYVMWWLNFYQKAVAKARLEWAAVRPDRYPDPDTFEEGDGI